MKWIIAFLLYPSLSLALVNPLSGGYSTTAMDIQSPQPGSFLNLSRTYNSASLAKGIFGQGWCSEFETKIEATPEGGLALVRCGSGQALLFNTRSTKSIEQILKKLKQKTSVNEEAFRRDYFYRRDLYVRFFARPSLQKTKPGTYKSADQKEKIVFKNFFTHHKANGFKQIFSQKGLLTKIFLGSSTTQLIYAKNKLIKVKTNSHSYDFAYNQKGFVKKITSNHKKTATYKYQGPLLQSATNAWGNRYKYTYDDKMKLSKILFPDSSKEEIFYKTSGAVAKIIDQNKCIETFKFTHPSKKEERLFVQKKCGNKKIHSHTYKTFFKINKRGESVVSQTKKIAGPIVEKTLYSSLSGQPLKKETKDSKETYKYTSQGTLVEKTDGNQKSLLLVKNKERALIEHRRKTHNRFYLQGYEQLQYDKKGRIQSLWRSSGEKIKLAYNRNDQVTKISSSKGKTLKISYHSRNKKPEKVTLTGKGSLVFQYDGQGNLSKVQSKDLSISSEIQRLLEQYKTLIAKAGE